MLGSKRVKILISERTTQKDEHSEDLSERANQEDKHSENDWGPHQLGIVVPYRDRFEELLEFAPHMHNYLNAKKVRHKIFIVNQVDKHRYVFEKVSDSNDSIFHLFWRCDQMV